MKKYLLNEQIIIDLLTDNKIGIIDGGARGELFPPFKYVNKKILQIFRFDPETKTDIVNYTNEDIIFKKALWKNSDKIKLNVAIDPSASSVYPFNRDLQKHIDPHADKRKTKKVVEIESINLDQIIKDYPHLKIDFIKLDIHGAEFDVLEGAIEVLKTTLGMLIESWVIPIHKGQKTRGHVEALASDNQFYVFEENHMGKWPRLGDSFSKRQTVPIDTLFFKDPLLDKNITKKEDALKLIGIANLFGHNAFAMQLTQHFYAANVLDQKIYTFMIEFIKKHGTKTLKDKLVYKVLKLNHRFSDCSFK